MLNICFIDFNPDTLIKFYSWWVYCGRHWKSDLAQLRLDDGRHLARLQKSLREAQGNNIEEEIGESEVAEPNQKNLIIKPKMILREEFKEQQMYPRMNQIAPKGVNLAKMTQINYFYLFKSRKKNLQMIKINKLHDKKNLREEGVEGAQAYSHQGGSVW